MQITYQNWRRQDASFDVTVFRFTTQPLNNGTYVTGRVANNPDSV